MKSQISRSLGSQKDRKEYVLIAVNLKLKNQQEKIHATEDLVNEENMKYALESTRCEMSY